MLTLQAVLWLAVVASTPALSYPATRNNPNLDPASLAEISELTGVDATTLHPLVRREWPIETKEWLCINNDAPKDQDVSETKNGKWTVTKFLSDSAEAMALRAPDANGGTHPGSPRRFLVCWFMWPRFHSALPSRSYRVNTKS